LISFAVVGHEARLVEATDLAHSLGAVIVLDDGSLGAGANHLRAWEATATLEADYAVVLEDDAQPVPGFMQQAEQALAVTPEPVISFYAGTTRPKRWQDCLRPATADADRVGACWLTTTLAAHAVAIAIHTDLRDDWIDFATGHTLPPDERLTAWMKARDHRIAYSWPSLCNHADGPTLVRHGNTQGITGPRRAWRTGTRDTWTSKAVAI
jgi:GR25 family glycosyltransferase involved in LPS biosynthesis